MIWCIMGVSVYGWVLNIVFISMTWLYSKLFFHSLIFLTSRPIEFILIKHHVSGRRPQRWLTKKLFCYRRLQLITKQLCKQCEQLNVTFYVHFTTCKRNQMLEEHLIKSWSMQQKNETNLDIFWTHTLHMVT